MQHRGFLDSGDSAITLSEDDRSICLSEKSMSLANRTRLLGGILCCLTALAVWAWWSRYTYVQIHQSGRVLNLRENRLTGTIALLDEETKQWDYTEASNQEHPSSNAIGIALATGLLNDIPNRDVERIFLYTAQLNKDCLLADAIVHSDPEARQFTRKDFQSAERCLAYITGALDTLPGKTESIGGKQYEFAFRNQKLTVGDAVNSFNRYVWAHPESLNWSGVETLERALVSEDVATWLDFSLRQSPTKPTKTASGHTIPSEPTR